MRSQDRALHYRPSASRGKIIPPAKRKDSELIPFLTSVGSADDLARGRLSTLVRVATHWKSVCMTSEVQMCFQVTRPILIKTSTLTPYRI